MSGTATAATPAAEPAAPPSRPTPPSFAEFARLWLYVGLVNFGGPSAQIALMHRLVVDERRWLDEARFLHALNYCMLLPGPEAQQLATYVGWLLHGVRGGLVAGALFILPGFLVILALSALYAGFSEVPLVAALFFGIKAAVLAVVVEAVLRIGRRILGSRTLVVIAVAAFVAIFFLQVPFPVVVLAAALVGLFGSRVVPEQFALGGKKAAPTVEELGPGPGAASAARAAAGCLAAWLLPLGTLVLALGADHTFSQIALFFSQMAVVTFGGAYAVLAYVAQEAVSGYGWLRPGEMLDGLGLAETTPGPLILVNCFVGFLAAFRDPGALPPMLAGTFGAAVTLWVTFLPSFLWIFAGAPFVERLRGNRALDGALSAITAAVVGVIANLAVWFALHVLFAEFRPVALGVVRFEMPVPGSLDVAALVLAAGAMLALLRFHVGLVPVLAGAAVLGAVWKLAS